MKYIRTENGRIIDLNRTVQDDRLIHLDDEHHIAGWYWKIGDISYEAECYDWEIVSKSDSIEKLCDEFHGVIKGEGPVPHFEGYNLKDVLFEVKRYGHSVEDTDIYGAIWTDKGLIYVAKMNEKGELELI